jgi:hypothetical protein
VIFRPRGIVSSVGVVEPIWRLLALKKGHWKANKNVGVKLNECVLFCQAAFKMKNIGAILVNGRFASWGD